MNQCEETSFHYTLSQGNPDKLQDFCDNKLPPIDLLDIEKFTKILQLDSMKDIIESREVVYNNKIHNCCEVLDNKIYINPRYSIDECLTLVVCKLRKNQLHSRYDRSKLSIEELIVYNRSIEADYQVWLIKVLWEIRLSNIDRRMFYRFRDKGGFDNPLRTCFISYENMASDKWTSLYDGSAFYDAFVSWFVSYPVKLIDTKTIQYALSNYNNCLSPGFSLWFMKRVFTLNNKSYIPDKFINEKDPLFTEVRDRSSSNFVWFIKFERSFREAEEDIQNSTIAVDSPPECVIIDFNEFKNRRSK